MPWVPQGPRGSPLDQRAQVREPITRAHEPGVLEAELRVSALNWLPGGLCAPFFHDSKTLSRGSVGEWACMLWPQPVGWVRLLWPRPRCLVQAAPIWVCASLHGA